MRVWLLLVVACSTQPMNRPCSPSTCDGCCDGFGQCHGGTEAGACGIGGTGCVACAASQGCETGACLGNSGFNVGRPCTMPNEPACGMPVGLCNLRPHGGMGFCTADCSTLPGVACGPRGLCRMSAAGPRCFAVCGPGGMCPVPGLVCNPTADAGYCDWP